MKDGYGNEHQIRREKGRKTNGREEEGRRASGKLPPIKDLHLHPLPCSPSLPPPSSLRHPTKMDPNEDPLPLPSPLLGETIAIPPDSDESEQQGVLPLVPPYFSPLPSLSPPSPTPPPYQNVPTFEVIEIANKFKNDPKLLLETTTYKDDITKLVLNLPKVLDVWCLECFISSFFVNSFLSFGFLCGFL
jgi:hypothetical protein